MYSYCTTLSPPLIGFALFSQTSNEKRTFLLAERNFFRRKTSLKTLIFINVLFFLQKDIFLTR
jgi:hypothetical protein